MNPNALTRELRNLPDNVYSDRLPGGSLISAALDRKLMTWSDRGGASRVFGEVWSEFAWRQLSRSSARLPDDLRVVDDGVVLRLDDHPRIATQAGRNKLPNPDFLLIDSRSEGLHRVRAIDAKFAIDRLRRLQIDPESTQTLIELPGSLTRAFVRGSAEIELDTGVEYEPGAFLAPRTILNEYYYEAHINANGAEIAPSELILVDVTEPELFDDVPERELMSRLREMDRLPVLSDATDIVAGMYYLRLAYAARWFEEQTRLPLLSLEQPEPVHAAEVAAAATDRLRAKESAFKAIQGWSQAVEAASERQSRIRDAARIPIRMAEIRELVTAAGLDDKKSVRIARGRLERRFMQCLIEEIGEIPAQPSESISSLVTKVRNTSRTLRPEMRKQAVAVVDELASGERPASLSQPDRSTNYSDAASS